MQVTALVVLPVFAWWGLFLVVVPASYRSAVEEHNSKL